MRTLYGSVNGVNNLLSAIVSESHSAQHSTAIVECGSTSLNIGDAISINLGYDDDHGVLFTGYVKQISVKEPELTYVLTCADELIRAADFFIASTNPEAPATWSNITAEDLVENVLDLAGITDYYGQTSHFTFAIQNPLEVNLTSAYDYCKFISNLIVFSLYADRNGRINFLRRLPYVTDDDTASSFTIGMANVTNITKNTTDRNLRNRVVVYGSEGIYAEAKAYSPYVPAEFYRTAVVAAPQVFDDQGMAQQAADYNLELYNRLTESVNIIVAGSKDYKARQIATANRSEIGVSGLWYVFSTEHSWNKSGYTTTIELRK